MKFKLLNIILIASSLIGYLEWGNHNHVFLAEAEIDIIQKLFTNPQSALHPLTVLPLIGQIILLITLFQKQPSKLYSLIGIYSLGILFVLMFVIGVMSLNFKIMLSIVPFIATAIYTIISHQKTNKA